ncbi:carbohydrate ABC transporter permease [Dactylosporangium sp. McL0621]|uniref:carbohydrate ABC transporter permease n=1 Tax=Dactylosporangium sp. McL0621 TaxID=3415678 RepID=UPI003CF20518
MTESQTLSARGRTRVPGRAQPTPHGRSVSGSAGKASYFFVAGYVTLLLMFGIVPVVYALWLALTNSDGQLVGVGNFTRVFADYRFVPAFSHVGLYILYWLISLMVLVVTLALMLHGRFRRTTSVIRFLYYLPGAFAGASSVLLWLILLDPVASPAGFLLRAAGWKTSAETIAPGHLPVIFTVIAFWTGAGSWIIIMYGALNGIPEEVLQAARIDGANPFQIAMRIQIPLLRKWIAYMLILAFAGGTQLFVEPQLVGTASFGQVPAHWSPNQLSYVYAFQAGDFNGAAAIAVCLLVLSLICAAIAVFKARLFERG